MNSQQTHYSAQRTIDQLLLGILQNRVAGREVTERTIQQENNLMTSIMRAQTNPEANHSEQRNIDRLLRILESTVGRVEAEKLRAEMNYQIAAEVRQ